MSWASNGRPTESSPTDGVLALVVGAKPLKSPGALMIELSALREEDHGFSQFAQPFRYYCVGDAATRFARIVAHEGEAEDLIGRLVMVEIMLERDWSNGPSRWRMLVKNPKRPNPGVAQRAFAWLGAQDATGTQ